MYKILLPLASLAAGATIGSILTVNASLDIAKYLSIAILAALDSVLGGARALLEDTYDSLIMLSGFFINALLAMALFRHKIRKPPFRYGVPLLLATHAALLLYAAGQG